MRIVFAGTPDFSVPPLKALIAEHEVLAVFTQPDRHAGRGKKVNQPPVKALALEHDLPVFQPPSLRKDLQNISAQIEQLKPDVMVVVAYGMILPQAILDIPRLGCINIHASILPRWRGAAPIQRAIEAGDSKTGISIMQMEAGLDTGPVFQILRTEINKQDTAASLHDRLSELGAQGIIETLTQLAIDPNIKPVPQDDSQATHAAKLSKDEAQINWQASAAEIQAQIRAFNPWPISQTWHTRDGEGNRIRIWQAVYSDDTVAEKPGTIVALDQQRISVACGGGQLQIEVLQRDGGKPLPVLEFCNGYTLRVGERFSSQSKAVDNAE